METTRSEASITQKQKLEREISTYQQQIRESEEKRQKYLRLIVEKLKEIIEAKGKIKDLAEVETKSKAQIDQHIEMLTWLIDTIDNTVNDLKTKMIGNSEKAIQESALNFKDYVQDLQEIITPLAECKKIKNPDELTQTVVSIAESLKLFADNIDESISSMAKVVKKANEDAVDESSNEFDAFIQDIHQIFDTFNSILQKLKLTNSVKKYLEIEEIYSEINRIIDLIAESQKMSADFKVQIALREEEIKNITMFPSGRDYISLTNFKAQQQRKLDEVSQTYQRVSAEYQEMKEKFIFISNEKNTIHDWFQALTDEVVERQNEAGSTYAIMYALLDNIHSTISSIKGDLRGSSENAIIQEIDEFTKRVQNFGKMVAIIKKVESSGDFPKMQRSIDLIAEKSKSYFKEIQNIVPDMSKSVRQANIEGIKKSFVDFDKFVETFKQKFFIIQDAVASITLSTSEGLIGDLSHYSEDQINFRQSLLQKEGDVYFIKAQKQALEKMLQGLENELKIFATGDDKKRRKYLKEVKTVSETDKPLVQEVTWEIKNDGIVPFSNFTVCDSLGHAMKASEFSRPQTKTQNWDDSQILLWTIASLDKKETLPIKYNRTGFTPLSDTNRVYTKNLSTPKTFRFRNLGKVITLTIIERDGKGAIILTNTSDKDKVWNITLDFGTTPEITPERLMVNIAELNPQESFIKKYKYKKAGVLVPKLFVASAKYAMSIAKKRSTEKDNQYNCEISFENRSDFILHMTRFEGYPLSNLSAPIIQVKPHYLEVLRPKLDFRANFDIDSIEDPPSIVLVPEFTVELVYDYDVDSRINIEDLRETPEKELKITFETKKGAHGKAGTTVTAVATVVSNAGTAVNNIHAIPPELQALDMEIETTSREIKDVETKLTLLKGKIDQKLHDRELLLEKFKIDKDQAKLKAEHESKLAAQRAVELKAKEIEEKQMADKIKVMEQKIAEQKKTQAAEKQKESSADQQKLDEEKKRRNIELILASERQKEEKLHAKENEAKRIAAAKEAEEEAKRVKAAEKREKEKYLKDAEKIRAEQDAKRLEQIKSQLGSKKHLILEPEEPKKEEAPKKQEIKHNVKEPMKDSKATPSKIPEKEAKVIAVKETKKVPSEEEIQQFMKQSIPNASQEVPKPTQPASTKVVSKETMLAPLKETPKPVPSAPAKAQPKEPKPTPPKESPKPAPSAPVKAQPKEPKPTSPKESPKPAPLAPAKAQPKEPKPTPPKEPPKPAQPVSSKTPLQKLEPAVKKPDKPLQKLEPVAKKTQTTLPTKKTTGSKR